MTKRLFLQAKSTDGLKNLSLFLILLTLFGLISSVIYLNHSPQIYSVCLNSTCEQLSATKTLDELKNYNQNIEVDLIINQNGKNMQRYIDNSSNLRDISIISHSNNTLTVGIPMRKGSSKFFPISIPVSNKGGSISIKIFDSREFVITLDDKLVYSHRYLAPVFYINPVKAWNTASELSDGMYSISLVKLKIDYNVTTHQSRRTLAFLIFLIFFCSSWILKEALLRIHTFNQVKIYSKLPTSVLILFWATNVMLWIRGVRDDTGSLHPSPFGPIGAAFSDMMQIFQAGKFTQPYIFSAVNYPPLALSLIRFIPGMSEGLLVLVISVLSFALLWWLSSSVLLYSKNGGKFQKFLIFLLPYPVVFSLLRGNLDLLASIFVGIGVILATNKHPKLGGSILGVAIALKIWPAFFIILFVKRKNYQAILISILSATILTFLSFYALGYQSPILQIKLLLKTLDYFNGEVQPNTFVYSYSFGALVFVAILVAKWVFGNQNSTEIVASSIHFFSSYEYLILFAALLVLVFYLLFKSKRIDSIFFICSGVVLLSSSLSYTYRASILIIALWIRANYSSSMLRLGSMHSCGSEDASGSKLYKLATFLERVAWLCILAPSTFVYAAGTLLSTSSVLQPVSVLYLLLVEHFCERSKTQATEIGDFH